MFLFIIWKSNLDEVFTILSSKCDTHASLYAAGVGLFYSCMFAVQWLKPGKEDKRKEKQDVLNYGASVFEHFLLSFYEWIILYKISEMQPSQMAVNFTVVFSHKKKRFLIGILFKI